MIGFGFIGKVHAHSHLSLPLFYNPLPSRTRLIGVCTASKESGDRAVEQAGFEFATQDISELIAHPEIKIIDICAPNDIHYLALKESLIAKKHIYCDKPLALNLKEADEICALSAKTDSVRQVTFNYRYIPAILRARELIEEGSLGDLFSFRIAYLHAGYIDAAKPFSWRTEMKRSGGGAIMDLGAHAFDLLRFLTGPGSNLSRGGEIHSVSATLQTVIPERKDPITGMNRVVDVDDIAIAQCRLEGGAIGIVESSRLATGTQDELRLELHGSRGGIRFNLMEPNWLDYYDARSQETSLGGNRGYKRIESVSRFPAPYSLGVSKNTVGWTQFHIQSMFDFINNITLHETKSPQNPWSPTFEDGLSVQKVIHACQISSQNQSLWIGI